MGIDNSFDSDQSGIILSLSSQIRLEDSMNIALSDKKITQADIDALRTKFMADQFKIDVWLRDNCDKVTSDAREELRTLGATCALPKKEILNSNVEHSKQEVLTMLRRLGISGVEFNHVSNGSENINTNILELGGNFYVLYVSKITGGVSMMKMNGRKSMYLDVNGNWAQQNIKPEVSIPIIQSAIKKIKT